MNTVHKPKSIYRLIWTRAHLTEICEAINHNTILILIDGKNLLLTTSLLDLSKELFLVK
jgi:hypothetical protein